MAEIASAFVTVAPSAKGFGSSLSRQVGGETRSAGQSIGRTFGKMFVLGASLIAAAGIGSFLKGSIDEAREAQKVGAATAAILKATGGAANLSAKQIGSLATALSLKTGVDDEAIQSGENLLLTFKNVKTEGSGLNDIFGRATAAGLDLAATGFGSVESNAKTLGKALNDPTKGITALTRAGVTFTDAQKEQIAGFVESGNLLGAQKVILGEVEKQVGGVAAATATSGDKAKVAFGNIKEQVGTALLPVIDRLADAFVSLAPSISRGISSIGPLFRRAQAFLAPFVAQVLGFFQGSGGSAIRDFATGAIGSLKTNLLPVLQAMGTTFTTKILPAVRSVASYIATNMVPIFVKIGGIIRDQVIPILSSLAVFFYTKVYPAIIDIASAVAKNLKPIFDQLFETFQAKVLPAIKQLLDAFQRAQPTIQKVVLVVLKVVGAVLKFVAAVLAKVLPVVIRLIGFLISKLVPAFIKIIATVVKVIAKIIDFGKKVFAAAEDVSRFVTKVVGFFTKLATSIRQKVSNVVSTLKGLPAKMLSALGDLGKILYDAGKKIIEGLIKGILAKFGDLKKTLGDVGGFIKNHKGPPAKDKVMLTPAGKLIMQGLIDGINAKKKDLDHALGKVSDKVKEKIGKVRDALSSVRSDFASLVDPIASNFTQSLFDFENAGDFTANLTAVKGTLQTLMANFKKLIGEGLNPGFLYQLFQSGGPGLINSLADLSAADAQAAGNLFGDVSALSTQLGTAVAGSTDKGAALEKQTAALTKKLDKLTDAVKDQPRQLAEALNAPAGRARRRAVHA